MRFSMSHSGDVIFLVLADRKVAVDVEKVVERKGISPQGSRLEFYVQRCAKECMVKFLDLPLDAAEEMIVVSQGSTVEVSYQGQSYVVRVREQG